MSQQPLVPSQQSTVVFVRSYEAVGSVLNITHLIQGDVLVRVAAVDLARNVDPSPVNLTVLVISQAPATSKHGITSTTYQST